MNAKPPTWALDNTIYIWGRQKKQKTKHWWINDEGPAGHEAWVSDRNSPQKSCLSPAEGLRRRRSSTARFRGGDTRSPLKGGLVSQHSGRLKTIPETRVSVGVLRCDQISPTGRSAKRPTHADLDEVGIQFWGPRDSPLPTSCPDEQMWSRASCVVLSGVCFCYGRQLLDPGLIVVPGQDRSIGVNVIHREEERDWFYLGPKRWDKTQMKTAHDWKRKTILWKKVSAQACAHLFLWTYPCKECPLLTFPPSSPAEDANMPLLLWCWIASCSLPHPESLWRFPPGLASFADTPVRPEFMEYLRTVMTALSAEERKTKHKLTLCRRSSRVTRWRSG